MKLAYVLADRYIPVFGSKGASIHVQEMVNAFATMGHGVTLIAARRGAQTRRVGASIVEVWGNVSPDSDAGLLQGDEKRRAKERHALEISDVIRDRLIEFWADNPFDFIYERYSLFSSAGIRAAREIGVPYLVEVNSPLLLEQQQFRKLCHIAEAEAVEAEVFSGADAVLAVSEQVRDYAVSRRARRERTYVVPNAVNIKRFHPQVTPQVMEESKGRFVIGFVGSLKPWHGLEVLMDALKIVAALDEDAFHLLIVGDGPLRDWIEGYACGAGLDGCVTVTGWLSNDDLPALIKTMDVAMAPYPAMEGFYFSPLKLYEYMAVGTPVIASRLGQITEVIDDGVTGLLSVPGDAAHLAECIERLWRDEVLRTSIGAAAAQLAAERTWGHNARQVLEIVTALQGT